MLSASNKIPVCVVLNAWKQGEECGVCVWVRLDVWKTGVLKPLLMENKRPGLWVKDHIWPMDSIDMKSSTSMCFVFCCVKDTLCERQRRSGHWGGDAHPVTVLSNTVLLCDCPPSILHTGTSLQPPGPKSEVHSGQGKWLWSPLFPGSLIHPACNEWRGC